MSNPVRLNLFTPPERVDRENHIIRGVSATQAVEAKGHRFLLDQKSVEMVAALGSGAAKGIKSRFTHPGLSADGMGKFLGRANNWRVRGDSAVMDLHLSDLAAKSPSGDLRDYVEELAEKEADMFGMSIVFSQKLVWKRANGEEMDAKENSRPDDATTKIPISRPYQLDAVDLVDEPAANRAGLFGETTSQLSAQVFSELDYHLAALDFDPNDLSHLFALYRTNPQQLPPQLLALADANIEVNGFEENKVNSFINRYVQARQVRPLNQVSLAKKGGIQMDPDEVVLEEEVVEETAVNQPAATPPQSDNGWLNTVRKEAVTMRLSNSGLPKASIGILAAVSYDTPAELDTAIEAKRVELAALAEDGVIDIGNRPQQGITMRNGDSPVRAAALWLFGDPDAELPAPSLRSSAEIYHLLTGDVHWRGVFDGATALASASPTTLPGLAVDAMNKVMINKWETLGVYRWFEQIVAVQPNNGSLHDMKWIQFGGLSNLSVVDDGGVYTEKSVGDTKEADAFVKHGNYVGITRKMLRNSLIGQIQAVPNALAIAAIRTRSANIANIFTQNSGVGPTLDQDSVPLFHTASHGNLATTAYSIAAWKAARLECFVQTELTSGKRQGLWPGFALAPADLYDQMLIDFGFGAGPGGYSGTPNNDVNPYAQARPGDPRPVPLAVPEFTDSNDWAYIADPVMAPIIQMSYSQNPGGRTHPLPELFSVVSETAGLMFTNDTMPIKIRDEYAYGVATYRGIGKRNVA